MKLWIITTLFALTIGPPDPVFEPESAWVAAVEFVESSGNPCATNGDAVGAFQMMYAARTEVGVSYVDLLCDRQAAYNAFVRYIRRYHYIHGGNTTLILTVWSAGPGAAKRGIVPLGYLIRWGWAYAQLSRGVPMQYLRSLP